MDAAPTGGRFTPRWYEIRIEGHLEPRWSAWFDGLALTCEADGTTVLRGPVADQAALHGVLRKLRDLSVTLLSVARVGHQRSPIAAMREGDRHDLDCANPSRDT